ncbi:MAG: hypothetical protein A3C03_01610 [Candidatus Colwellbacteria bacterium RIFCSPHIGHO2_02_FULL_45_17]|uniref:Uncharacterized protein n=2 Tax=Candidatus Colwelliibacteriota TaxID=1817904 RepID=A0A1G1ZBC4_9BACT|nr:MAG: hypothetical protein A3C03_01610 [Candidatus Colwellbacteria bacterium RIFCSPHIGHO2_02_FULL_45_17]OGY61117.1 MAG: hypothetical protein A3I33_01370 [Candidatus Colwellbacteria bacterium RIFCSPLOWO2_02_FULL_45_11]OGY61951.1 MAG: hypothetical protein A3G58_02785 [Candidatus Colwellbacteria bacterium RIFCSPLOWO2_12_FULL_46_17]
MTQNELIKKLGGLRAIEPNEEFVRVSRSVILSSQSGIPIERTTRNTIFSRGLSFAASVTLTAVFVLVLALGSVAGSLKTLFLPTLHGVNNEALVSEADAVTGDIDIRLNDIEYFDRTSRTVALADSSQEGMLDGEDEIDELLNQVIEY